MELEQCPFCKSTDTQLVTETFTGPDGRCKQDKVFYVRCDDCGARGPGRLYEDDACAMWNSGTTLVVPELIGCR